MGRSCGTDYNFADFLEIVTRVMHGLLAYDGDVYHSINTSSKKALKTPHKCAKLRQPHT
jgi:hypothetical protein